jgi:hypothetical protein
MLKKPSDWQTPRGRIVVTEWPAKIFTEKPSQSTILHVDRPLRPATYSICFGEKFA